MPDLIKSWRRTRRAAYLRARELRMIFKGVVSTDHPILAHIIPMRRCNLACTYCNEFDDNSKPVPLETVVQRLDLLADLGTTIMTISGESRCCILTWTLSSRTSAAGAQLRA